MKVLHIADPDCPETTTGYKTTPPAGLLCAADHAAQGVRWLWPNRIPIGKITLLAGDPGLGKSLLALEIAARTTRGLPFPDAGGTPGASSDGRGDSVTTHHTPEPSACVFANSSSPNLPPSQLPLPPTLPGSTLILSANDDFHDTILPRLEAAGADPNRVFVLPTVHDLRHDFAALRAAVESIPDCRLIIIDPINAYVGPSDAHFHTVVRRVLEPLAQLATEKSLAILAITHLNKGDGAAIQRAAGSMGFVSTARTIWTLARDPADPTRTLLLPLKNNLAPTACGLAFQITTNSHSTHPPESTACGLANQNGVNPPNAPVPASAPHLLWDPTPVTISPREALRPAPTPKPPRRPTDREEAANFLREALAAGPRPANELIDAGAEHGFHRRTLQRAFHDLAGHTAKRGWTAGWWWSLGEYPLDLDPDLENLPPNAIDEVTYAHDVTFQNKLDELHQEVLNSVRSTPAKHLSPSSTVSPSTISPQHSPIKPATIEQSITYLERLVNNRHANKPKPK